MNLMDVGAFAKLLQEQSFTVACSIVFVLLVAVWIYQGFSRLVEPVYFWRNRRRELLDGYLATHAKVNLAPEMLVVVTDMRDAIYFHEATGIHAEQKWRLLLTKLHQQTSPNVSWRTIKFAKDYLKPDSADGLKVLDFNGFEYAAMTLLGAMVVLLIMACTAFLYTLQGYSLQTIASWSNGRVIPLFIAGLMLAFGLFITIRSALPYLATNKIRKELLALAA